MRYGIREQRVTRLSHSAAAAHLAPNRASSCSLSSQ